MTSIALSPADLARIARASSVLLSPLDYGSVDEWRLTVNRELKDLLHADSAGFLLPIAEGLPMYSEEHDPDELARYTDLEPPALRDGTPIWARALELGVATLEQAYGEDHDVYLRSPYYNEYAGANGAHDTLSAGAQVGGADFRSVAALQFWHARPDGPRFGDREVALLRLLYPAFRSGVEACLRWSSLRGDLIGMLEQLGQAVLVCDLDGQPLHRTRALEHTLAADLDGERILAVSHDVARAVRETCVKRRTVAPRSGEQAFRELRTRSAKYTIRGSVHSAGLGQALILVTVDRETARMRPQAELQRVFGLTPAEVQVACLISQRKQNAEIAAELYISPHTARRHTERVLKKLGVDSRTQVAPMIMS